MPMQQEPQPVSHEVGRLCIGGDWACAHGDLEALRHVAQCLAAFAHEPMHCELFELAEACTYAPDHAVDLWVRIKGQLLRSSAA